MSDVRPYYRRHSLFGPLLIAGLGVVFLLRNLGVISYRNFGWWFARYWPLLLIFWGVVKFLEYAWARRRNEPYSGVGAGGVVFVVFLVLCGVAATSASRMDWNWVDDSSSDWDGFGIFGTRYDFTDTFAQPMVSGAQIKVLSARGDITIKPSPDDQAHVVVHKFIRSQSQNDANQINSSTRPSFQQQGTVWLLDLTGGNFGQGRFDVVLEAPSKYAVSVLARRGDVHISQMQADVDAESSHGDIAVDEIKGNVLLRPHRNDVSLNKITGNVTIDGDVGDSAVSDVTGTLTFSTVLSGDIQLSHVAGSVHFRSSRTDMQFVKLDGDLSMNGDDLHANAISGPFTLSTQTKDVHLDGVTGGVHIDDHRADIEVQTKTPLGNVDITTTGGEINLGLPDNAGFQVDARSDQGEIQSDFGLSLNNQSTNATASGTVGKGGPQVRLRTDRGTIQIHKIG